jgi:four helix bundle protein
MTKNELRQRTKSFALDVLRAVEKLPRNRPGDVLGRQLLRSSTSVAANYRSACRARSRRDFIAKMGIVEEEADETGFWLEMISEAGLADSASISPLQKEANEIVAMTVASIRTARHARPVPRSSVATPQSAIRNPQCS